MVVGKREGGIFFLSFMFGERRNSSHSIYKFICVIFFKESICKIMHR